MTLINTSFRKGKKKFYFPMQHFVKKEELWFGGVGEGDVIKEKKTFVILGIINLLTCSAVCFGGYPTTLQFCSWLCNASLVKRLDEARKHLLRLLLFH